MKEEKLLEQIKKDFYQILKYWGVFFAGHILGISIFLLVIYIKY